MPKEDKFKREIDRIGIVLAKLLSMMLHKDYPYGETMNNVSQQLRSELGLDLDEFLAMKDGDDAQFLVKENAFSVEHLRNFANMLYDLAQKATDAQQKALLQKKALNIYEYIHAHPGGTIYLDVEYRIRELR